MSTFRNCFVCLVLSVSTACVALTQERLPSPPSNDGLDANQASSPPPPNSSPQDANSGQSRGSEPVYDVPGAYSSQPVPARAQRYTPGDLMVKDVHLKYGIATSIRAASPISSIALGDQNLFTATFSPDEPMLIQVSPKMTQPASTNMNVILQSGQALIFRLISVGNGHTAAVDYFIDMRLRTSMLHVLSPSPDTPITSGPMPTEGLVGYASTPTDQGTLLNALTAQKQVRSPRYMDAKELARLVKGNDQAPHTLAVALGNDVEHAGTMTVTYSVKNISNVLVEVMAPQIQYANPHIKKRKKNRGARAEDIPLMGYYTTPAKLAPGQRQDGVLMFIRPDYKQYEEKLLLEIASAAAVDYPLMTPLPFVAPGQDQVGR